MWLPACSYCKKQPWKIEHTLQGCYHMELHNFERCWPWHFRSSVCKNGKTYFCQWYVKIVNAYVRLKVTRYSFDVSTHLSSDSIVIQYVLVFVMMCSYCTWCVHRGTVLTTCVTALHLHHYPSTTDMCKTNMGYISLLRFQAPFDLQKIHC